MKILLISNMYPSRRHPRYGIFVKNFTNELSLLGFTFSKAVLCNAKKVGALRKAFKYIVLYLKIIYKGVFVNKHDLIYVHFPIYVVIPAFIISLFSKKPIVINFHGSDLLPNNLLKKILFPLQKIVINKAICVVVPSMYYKQKVNQVYGTIDDKIYIYPSGGINPKIFKPYDNDKKRELRSSLGYLNDSFILGFIGNFILGKGWKILLKSITEIKKIIPDIQCIMIGDGPDKEQVIKFIENYGIENNVKLIDSMPQRYLVKFINIFDLFVFPTLRQEESLGLVGLEAMACKCIVVGSDLAGLKDYCIDEKNAFLFRPGDPIKLSEKILKYYGLSAQDQENMKMTALATSKKFHSSTVTQKLALKLRTLVNLNLEKSR